MLPICVSISYIFFSRRSSFLRRWSWSSLRQWASFSTRWKSASLQLMDLSTLSSYLLRSASQMCLRSSRLRWMLSQACLFSSLMSSNSFLLAVISSPTTLKYASIRSTRERTCSPCVSIQSNYAIKQEPTAQSNKSPPEWLMNNQLNNHSSALSSSLSGLVMTSRRVAMSEASMKGTMCSNRILMGVRRNWEDLVRREMNISTSTCTGLFLSPSPFRFFLPCTAASLKSTLALSSFSTTSRSANTSTSWGKMRQQKPAESRKLRKAMLKGSFSSLLSLNRLRICLIACLTSACCSPSSTCSKGSLARMREARVCSTWVFLGLEGRRALKIVFSACKAPSSFFSWYLLTKTVTIWQTYSTVSSLCLATRNTSNSLQWLIFCSSWLPACAMSPSRYCEQWWGSTCRQREQRGCL